MIMSVFSKISPGPFDDGGKGELQRKAPARANEVQEAVEDEAVDDVRKGVPVGDVLGIFRTEHHPVPELDVSALANGLAAQWPTG